MILLSFAREDGRAARRLNKLLSAHGFAVFRDEPTSESNPFWRTAIEKQLRTTSILVVLWTRSAARSPWVNQEVRAFRGRRIWLCDPSMRRPRTVGGEDSSVRSVDGLMRLVHRIGPQPVARAASPPTQLDSAARRQAYIRGRAALERIGDRLPSTPRLVRGDDGALEIERTGIRLRFIDGRVAIGTMPVTVGQYARFVEESGCSCHPAIDLRRRRRALPVVSVTWFEAMACAAWFGGTLPSEEEWQRAAMAGARLRHATSSGAMNSRTAWFGRPFATGEPKPATDYPPNAAGFYGMCGNTWDWCRTAWGSHRVIRGGSWLDAPLFCATTARYRNAPVDRDCTVGFRMRLAVTPVGGDRYRIVRRK